MSSFDPLAYGPRFAPLVDVDRCRALSGEKPVAALRPALAALAPESAFAHTGRPLAERAMADCCLSAVWLLHDFLDESHTISQGIENASGSFWHAIMHRREGDFSNAKYWFRRVGAHPIFPRLAARAATLAAPHSAAEAVAELTPAGGWDSLAFVDLCQQAVRHGTYRDFCRAVQQAEWELLFDDCYQRAIER